MFDHPETWQLEAYRAGPGGPLVPVIRHAAVAVRCKPEAHDLLVQSERRWWRLFRRRHVIRCRRCDTWIAEP